MLKRTTSRKLTPLPTLMVPTNMSYEKEALSLLYVENRPLSDFSVFLAVQDSSIGDLVTHSLTH